MVLNPLWEIDLTTNSARWLVADIGFGFEIRFREYESDEFRPSDLRVRRVELPPNFRLSLRALKSLLREGRQSLHAVICAELGISVGYETDFPEAKTA